MKVISTEPIEIKLEYFEMITMKTALELRTQLL